MAAFEATGEVFVETSERGLDAYLRAASADPEMRE